MLERVCTALTNAGTYMLGHVCVALTNAGTYMVGCVSGSQKTVLGSWFSPSTVGSVD